MVSLINVRVTNRTHNSCINMSWSTLNFLSQFIKGPFNMREVKRTFVLSGKPFVYDQKSKEESSHLESFPSSLASCGLLPICMPLREFVLLLDHHKNGEFEESLGCTARSCLKQENLPQLEFYKQEGFPNCLLFCILFCCLLLFSFLAAG